ncbi:MAG: DUF3467 domain-containing protein [Candidatus Komeilibacteria bacterium]|nr:DUF3467 domain-containing protein [Candidatus Komeilibacteria bacterium]
MTNENKSQIQISDNIAGAEYTNAMQIRHNKDEFQMIFMNLMPPSGRVVSKIVSTPGHMKRILEAMKDNLKKYEDQFGAIDEAEAPSGLGFNSDK